jgi:hypothetical protein
MNNLFQNRHNSRWWPIFKRLPVAKQLLITRRFIIKKYHKYCLTKWKRQLQSLLTPVSVRGLQLIRLGNPNADGGYLCAFKEKIDVLFSYGVRDDVSFDLDFINLHPNCQIHLFDHTIDNLPSTHTNFSFHRKGVGPRNSGDIETLLEHVELYCSTKNTLFIKMDIEGAEYETLLNTSHDIYKRISGLVIELHNISPYNAHTISLLNLLSDHFYLIHAHANNSGGFITTNDTQIPQVIECSFIRKDPSDIIDVAYVPNHADKPCDPLLPEINITDFLYSK